MLTVPRSEFESPAPPTSSPVTLEDAERDHILRALEQTGWVIGGAGGAAARLGLKRHVTRLDDAAAGHCPAKATRGRESRRSRPLTGVALPEFNRLPCRFARVANPALP